MSHEIRTSMNGIIGCTDIIERLPSSSGHRVTPVENGADALEAVRAGEFDLVLGVAATRAIRRLPGPAKISGHAAPSKMLRLSLRLRGPSCFWI